jgi:hypothetical protein
VTWEFPLLEEIFQCLRGFARFHRRDMIRIKQSESTTISSCLGGKFIVFFPGFAISETEIGCVLIYQARPLRANPRPCDCMDQPHG